jgi:exonuclease III
MKEQPNILLLQETKWVGEEDSQILSKCWKQAKLVEVDAKGAAGGIVILWNPSTILMEGLFTSKWTITTSFRLIGSNKPYFVMNFYDPATPGDKEAFLHHLEWIANHISNDQWILGGGFNMIIGLEEKKGGTRRLGNDSEQFHRIISLLNLIDVETDNGPFTWSNRRSRAHHVSYILDRFLIS